MKSDSHSAWTERWGSVKAVAEPPLTNERIQVGGTHPDAVVPSLWGDERGAKGETRDTVGGVGSRPLKSASPRSMKLAAKTCIPCRYAAVQGDVGEGGVACAPGGP